MVIVASEELYTTKFLAYLYYFMLLRLNVKISTQHSNILLSFKFLQLNLNRDYYSLHFTVFINYSNNFCTCGCIKLPIYFDTNNNIAATQHDMYVLNNQSQDF